MSGPGIPAGIRNRHAMDLTQLKSILRGVLYREMGGSELPDLFSQEERVLICKDLKGRTAAYYRGWCVIRDKDTNWNRITRKGQCDSTTAIARIDSTLFELERSSIPEFKRMLNMDETAKLAALGYAE